MITKKQWASQILSVLKFLSDPVKLTDSWIKGNGNYSLGYSEEMCVLFDDLGFKDQFIPTISQLNISEDTIYALNQSSEAFNDFNGDRLTEAQILESQGWGICMKKAQRAAARLESEIDLIPDTKREIKN